MGSEMCIRDRGLGPVAHIMGVAVLCQFALGLTTLLLGVPVWAGALHQAGAVVLLCAVLVVTHHLSARHTPLSD